LLLPYISNNIDPVWNEGDGITALSCLETKEKSATVVFDVIVLIEGEVGVVVGKVYALYVDWAIVGIYLLLVESGVLE
jgi:hypothetical protein